MAKKTPLSFEDVISSKVHLKVILFFHENQACIDTPRGVSTWIGEDRGKVKKVLEDLVGLSILNAHRSTSTTGYSYTSDPKLIAKVGNFLKSRPT